MHKYLVILALASGVAGTASSLSASEPQSDDMTEREFKRCKYDYADLNVDFEFVEDLKSRYESTVRQANGMSDGPSRRALAKAAKNLEKAYYRDRDAYYADERRYNRKCDRISVTYEVYESVCDDRRFDFKRGSFCMLFPDFARDVKKQKGWS